MITGIYKITNIITYDFYIGSTRTSFHKRKLQHFSKLRRNKHDSPIFQNAWNKYGESNFEFQIVEICEESKVIFREQFYIDSLNPRYNVCKIAGSRKYIKLRPETILKLKQRTPHKHTEETKKQMSISHKGLNTWTKGVKFSEERKQQMSEARKGKKINRNKDIPAWNKGIPFNKEVRLKMSLAKKDKLWSNEKKEQFKQKIARYRPQVIRNDGKIYKTVSDAALELDVKDNTIIKAITDKKQIRRVKGFIFEYYKGENK